MCVSPDRTPVQSRPQHLLVLYLLLSVCLCSRTQPPGGVLFTQSTKVELQLRSKFISRALCLSQTLYIKTMNQSQKYFWVKYLWVTLQAFIFRFLKLIPANDPGYRSQSDTADGVLRPFLHRRLCSNRLCGASILCLSDATAALSGVQSTTVQSLQHRRRGRWLISIIIIMYHSTPSI